MIGEDVMVPSSEADQLRQQLLQAQKLSSVGALASSVAHEFNNILTTIINYARLALRQHDEAGRNQALEKILKGSQRAATIINSMLGFARNTRAQREMTDLVALVEETLVLTDKDLSKHRIHVDKKYHGRPRAAVVPAQIEQVLLNLIINARQAMPRGGHLRLEVRENTRTQMVELSVADSGIGIPPDRLRLIFEPFYTTKEPDAHGHGGTGLGLSVCRQIVEQHQGRIRVESVVGKGSTFIIKLPMQTHELPAAEKD
ncbi:MAG TPA: HAMP domain-containing sensor histidine kinase [Gemmataceae bacterium]|jgi:signal transduction histidine kinase